MKIAICDDEKSVRDDIEHKVKLFFSDCEIRKFGSGNKLLQEEFDADILFLDVQLPGKNGLEVAKILRELKQDLVIIFITAAEEYVFHAFDVNAFHYLIKPLDKAKFYEVLNKAIRHVQEKEKSAEVPAEPKKTIMIRQGAVHHSIVVDDIIFAEVFNRKILLHTKTDEFEYYGKLSELFATVGSDFFRPHRAFLVNMNHISYYDSKSIYVQDEEIPIAKAKHAEFVKEYLRFRVRKENEEA